MAEKIKIYFQNGNKCLYNPEQLQIQERPFAWRESAVAGMQVVNWAAVAWLERITVPEPEEDDLK